MVKTMLRDKLQIDFQSIYIVFEPVKHYSKTQIVIFGPKNTQHMEHLILWRKKAYQNTFTYMNVIAAVPFIPEKLDRTNMSNSAQDLQALFINLKTRILLLMMTISSLEVIYHFFLILTLRPQHQESWPLILIITKCILFLW